MNVVNLAHPLLAADGLAVEHLTHHFLNVTGVGIGGEMANLPHFGVAHGLCTYLKNLT